MHIPVSQDWTWVVGSSLLGLQCIAVSWEASKLPSDGAVSRSGTALQSDRRLRGGPRLHTPALAGMALLRCD
jgi:hypothetical protein